MATPESCPNCGAEVPPNAKACPQCGSCAETGWSESAEARHLDLPNDEFDYDEFVKREFGAEKGPPRGISPFWWIVAAVVVVLFAFLLFLR
jgi:uncharacterized membrane protein YvbJ